MRQTVDIVPPSQWERDRDVLFRSSAPLPGRFQPSAFSAFPRFGVDLFLAGGGYYAWQKWSAQEGSAKSILTAVVTRGNLEDTVTAIGTLRPKEFVDVGTRVSGQLKKLRVDIGAVVTKGQLLAEIDPSVYQAPEGIRVAPALRLLATLV